MTWARGNATQRAEYEQPPGGLSTPAVTTTDDQGRASTPEEPTKTASTSAWFAVMREAMVRPSEQTLAAGEMENRFRDAHKLVKDYVGGPHRGEGPAPIAIIHLLLRSLTDLGWGQYLASSGYPLQMYSVIRPVREALNLIELFVNEPKRAQDWVDGKFQTLTPQKVREELGIDRDPLYSWMAEHSHPRFAGLQTTTYRVKKKGETEWQNVMYPDELPLELPPVLIATTMPGLALMDVALAAGNAQVSAEPEDVAVAWATMVRGVGETLDPGFRAVWLAVKTDELEEDEFGERLTTTLGEALKQTQKLEEIAREAAQKRLGEG